MAVFRVRTLSREPIAQGLVHGLTQRLRHAGLPNLAGVASGRLYYLEGALTEVDAHRIAATLLADPVAETFELAGESKAVAPQSDGLAFEIHPQPGVMDPVALSTLAELQAEGYAVNVVRTARWYVATGKVDKGELLTVVGRVLANDCVEHVVLGSAAIGPAVRPPQREFQLRHVPMRALDDAGLQRLARAGHLFLNIEEMRAIQAYFVRLEREPTDLELETLAQTWSEHCVHKTLKSEVVYRGARMPGQTADDVEILYTNLLKDTIARATQELIAERRGPECLSVFQDNAGIIAFDERYGIAFKVETHNHPSAIEPYGGAATGIGGCIRDIMGCGLAARPIANTDVFCVAPGDWPLDSLPRGVLHPQRVLQGVVQGVADYGNRMGIPTVNGAICFDPRYLGNPLVYCGCVGLIPRDRVAKQARPGDAIVVIGGRTGRDGIHGATFSSAELTDSHADEFAHAVQIGNAITQKRALDALLAARDHERGCLYSAVTDCGAGGLSSAVGEMGQEIGASVDLDQVLLKYAGLRYDEIWISEAQERMVLAVPPAHLSDFLAVMQAEEVEASVIGRFGCEGRDRGSGARPALRVRCHGVEVGELDMHFLHEGLPKRHAIAEWRPSDAGRIESGGEKQAASRPADVLAQLQRALHRPTVASKAWVIRGYDHEVQGGSVVKPLGGRGGGPNDAAVLRPRLNSMRGIAVGCGLTPHLSDIDPYWMAAASIDEAIRNVVAVGGDPRQTAILDNFCWGRCDDPRQLGALVRACQACYDAARVYGTPFISGKDSLNNEYALHEDDVEPMVRVLHDMAGRESAEPHWRSALPLIEARIRATRRLSIPGTLLISAVSLIADVQRCVTADLKRPGAKLLLVGGQLPIDFSLAQAAATHEAVSELIAQRRVLSCHDVSDGGWLTALAEMAIGGDQGVELGGEPFGPPDGSAAPVPAPFAELCAAYLVETDDSAGVRTELDGRGVAVVELGCVSSEGQLRSGDASVEIEQLRKAWNGE